MIKEIKCDAGSFVYIAMSDRLVLFPLNRTSTMVWDMENDRSLGLLEGHTSEISRASVNNNEKTAVTAQGVPENEVYPVKIWSLETLQCTANLLSLIHI